MATKREPPVPGKEAVTAQDVELAERRVAEARERAALAGLSAARGFEESALQHEHLARVQDQAVAQGVPAVDMHRRSAASHRKAAVEDHNLAELKRRESEADLSLDADK